MPRRSDDSVRVGLCSIVRASSSSKLANVAGPRTKSRIALAFSPVTPGVTSTSTSDRTSSGATSVRAIEVSPPSDMPTTPRASGARRRTASARSGASSSGRLRPSAGAAASEWPWPGRSTATSGRSSARATVSQVWAFCAPPWTSTSSGSDVPHTSALTRRPSSSSTSSRRTAGGPSYGMPYSDALSAK